MFYGRQIWTSSGVRSNNYSPIITPETIPPKERSKYHMSKRLSSAEEHGRRIKLCRTENQCDVLRRMLSTEETFDVEFMVDGQRFPVHRLWVSAASPVLKKMLYNGMKESKENIVHLGMSNSCTWRKTLDFIYYKEFEIYGSKDGVELYECARYFQIKNMEESVFEALVSLMNQENCCEILFHADRLGSIELKTKAMDSVAQNFLFLTRNSNGLTMLGATLMEEVVASNKLKISSELDVLCAIAIWLNENRYDVETNNLKSYLSRDYDNLPDLPFRSLKLQLANTNIQKLGDEVVKRLTDCIYVDELSIPDLQCMTRLALDSKLTYFALRCVQRLLTKGPPFRLTTPIPARLRLVRARSTKLLSFKFCCSQITEHRKLGNTVTSEWVLDISGRKWQLQVQFFAEDQKWVRCFLRVRHGNYENEKDKNVGFQLYVISGDENKMCVWEDNSEVLKLETFKTGLGTPRFLPQSDIPKFIDNKSDSLVFGVTVYFGICMERSNRTSYVSI